MGRVKLGGQPAKLVGQNFKLVGLAGSHMRGAVSDQSAPMLLLRNLLIKDRCFFHDSSMIPDFSRAVADAANIGVCSYLTRLPHKQTPPRNQ